MSLVLAEIVPSSDVPDLDLAEVLRTVESVASQAGGEFIEAQVTGSKDRVFAIVEGVAPAELRAALGAAGLSVDDVAPVRLVGADLATIKAERPSSGYLVEWDLPAGLTMDAYLARKKEKSPLYAQVPETTFQRTYVREDMIKCLCFYDAPDEDAVRRARDVVSAPIDRLHHLADVRSDA
ncbi:MAG: DUF4242 domain-containing protein [Actinomycetota bacterium]|nr:DUF4242 domain-containing protein [Actinomycetota bacterium]MDA2972315.1 DUF4242 domain-containing protein [Actinomycetota bacterium]MDA3002109.1 DUF4242 domain-containing protein [Actinomycetota bacterium]